MKPSLSVGEQVTLLARRGLVIDDEATSSAFLAAHNYYRLSGYARYFQQAPHLGDDDFRPGTTFSEIRAIYEADEALRTALAQSLARVEILLRAHTARVVADAHEPCGRYLEEDFYTDVGQVLTGALAGDDGVVVVDDDLGVERPRPVVLGGAVMVLATWSSSA